MSITKAIEKKFHVHSGDNLPYEGWWNSTREDLIELFGEVGFTIGAEIGVRRGLNAYVMFQKIPNLKLYCIDLWGAYLKVTDERQEAYYKSARKRLKPFNAVFMRMPSMEAIKRIDNESLDFVYIDGHHGFDFVMEDIIFWNDKVKKGGIISGHDYYHFYQGGVVQAVDAYTRANNIKAWYITREKEHSWFWVKE